MVRNQKSEVPGEIWKSSRNMENKNNPGNQGNLEKRNNEK